MHLFKLLPLLWYQLLYLERQFSVEFVKQKDVKGTHSVSFVE